MESQSFTIKDARTQRDKQLEQENKKVLKQLRELDEYINKDVPVPTYPEPEGDPSY